MAKKICKMDNWLLMHLKGFTPMGVILVLQKPSMFMLGNKICKTGWDLWLFESQFVVNPLLILFDPVG